MKLTLEETLTVLEDEHKSMSLRLAKESDLPEQVIQTVEFFDHYGEYDNFEDKVHTVILAHLCADDLTDDESLCE